MPALLPRLSKAGVVIILARHEPGFPKPLDSATAFSTYPELISYAASGGRRAPDVSFAIGEELRQIAKESGAGSTLSRAEFDRNAAVYLASHPALGHGEALRNDSWAFITSIVAPDVVEWRFPDAGRSRFEGGVRNAFQRLWLRGRALDRGKEHPHRWELVHAFPEDAAVQIVERPSLGGRSRIARAIGEGWLEMKKETPQSRQEDVMRSAIKILRLQNQIVDLQFLSDDDLLSSVRQAFTKARPAL